MKTDEFNQYLKASAHPVLVYFWAPWCIPCRGMSPVIHEIAGDFSEQVELLKINADESPDILRELNIMSIPTLVAYSGDRVLFRRTGAQSSAALREIFSAALAARTPAPVLTPIDRTLRALAGAVLTVLALSTSGGVNVFLLFAGGLLLFSAVYDRCPIYRAVSTRLKSWIQKRRPTTSPGQ
jgi:thioredoxin 1